MPRISATTEQVIVTQVKLAPKTRQLVKARCEEHATLAKTVKELKGTKKKPGRMKRIEGEIEELFKKDKQGAALADGTKLDDYSLKMVCGKTKKFDQLGFMKKHGLAQADFDEFTSEEPNSPYLRITAPGEDDE